MPNRLRSRLIPNTAFARNVLTLSSATLFAQGVNIISLPILTRLFSPDHFGQFAVYAALLGIVAVMAGLRFELAISQPESDEDAIALVFLALGSTILVAIGFWLIWSMLSNVTVGGAALGPYIGVQYIWAVSLGIILVGFTAALQAWSARQKRYVKIAKSRMSQAVAGVTTNLAFGFGSPSGFGLVAGHLVFSGFGIASLLRELWIKDRPLLQSVSRTKLKEQAQKYKAFPIYSVPEALFNAGGWHIPVLVMSAYLAAGQIGQLMLATRLVGLPMVLIGQSVAQVYIAEAPIRARNGTLRAFTQITMINLAKISAVPILGLGILSPFLFPVIFGDEWARAGEIMAWLAPWYLVQMIVSPVTTALHVIGRLRLAMLIQLGGMLLRVVAVITAVFVTPEWTIETYAVSGIVMYLFQILVIDLALKRDGGAT